MQPFVLSAIAALAALLPTTLAQTHTACNPLNTTACPDMPALGGNATWYFNKTGLGDENDKVWRKENQGDVGWDEKGGATFTVARSGDSPNVQSRFYMLFGKFTVIMKAAKGMGIVSSAILQSEALDEIDWEFLGTKNEALTNYFGKGNTTAYDRGKGFPLSNPSPQDDFHNYTIDWTADRIEWWLDGNLLRTLPYGQALNGKNYPQTPMNIRLGIWAGGDQKNNDPGVVDWAGGETNFKDGPFTMMIREVYAQDYTSAATYSWASPADPTGSWKNIKVTAGKSKILEEIQKPTGVRNRWAALPHAAKIGIIAGSAGVLILGLLIMGFCCIKQRRAGAREHAALVAQEQKEAAELQEYKVQMQSGKFGFGSSPAHYRV